MASNSGVTKSAKTVYDGSDDFEQKCQREWAEYVTVAENEESERIELPLMPGDSSLSLNTLTHAFPGAHGLKYKNAVSGASRALLMDPQGTRFLPPADGWKDKTFFIIYSSRGQGDQNTKRKKMMDECEQEGDPEDSQGGRGGQLTAKQKRIEDPSEKTCIDLIVLGIPYKTSADTCKAYFEAYGEVVLFDLKTDANGVSKGFGFVRMADYEAQERILAKQTHEIDGRRCQVRIPLSKGEVCPTFVSRIFVGRLQEKTTADDLRKFFNEEAGKVDANAFVTDVFIPRPFRSFAFINFSSTAVAREMIKQGDFVINGYSVAVSAAAPRETDYNSRTSYNLPYSRRLPVVDRFGAYSDASPYGYDTVGGRPMDNWRSGAYRADSRGSNRFSPGYSSSPRYTAAGRTGTSQALASGLDALNLNKMNPDVMDAAWQAFWNTLNSGSGGASSANNAAPSGATKW